LDPEGPGGRQFLSQGPERCQRIRARPIHKFRLNTTMCLCDRAKSCDLEGLSFRCIERTQPKKIWSGVRVVENSTTSHPDLRTNAHDWLEPGSGGRPDARRRRFGAAGASGPRALHDRGRSEARAAISVASSSTMRATTPSKIATSARLKARIAFDSAEPRCRKSMPVA